MNRRGFFGLLGKLIAVGATLGISPEILAPVQAALPATESAGTNATVTEAQVTFTYSKPDYKLAA